MKCIECGVEHSTDSKWRCDQDAVRIICLKNQLENLKKENEQLKKQVEELEQHLAAEVGTYDYRTNKWRLP